MNSPDFRGPTPVRSLGTRGDDRVQVLSETGSQYADGAEADVLRIITEAQNLHSTSDEMIITAKTWAQRYHLDPSRANVLRGLALPADARVLEIGAGCGAITRFLGETCAVVDALEPVPSRAAAAAARTRDLPGVQVFAGALSDVPAEATYDVIVVVGVLEYTGAGVPELEPYLAFLGDVFDRLRDGGTLVLAIENKLGVKYLVGSPEDHTGRVFDSVEGYPIGGKARTFSRAELEDLLRTTGLDPHTLIAFPDYKMTRAVFERVPESARSLLYRVPRFPSPDWTKPRPRLADEGAVWRSIVDGGLATDFGNSFLVLAGKGAEALSLWPSNTAGVFYSRNRRPELNTETFIEFDDSGVRFRRAKVVPGSGPVNGLTLVESVSPYAEGRDFIDVLAEGGESVAAPVLEEWLRLLEKATDADAHVPMDLVPHNFVIADDGSIAVIDIELFDERMGFDGVVRRGVFWLAERVTRLAPAPRWSPHTTVGDVMSSLGAMAGLPADGSWIETAIAEETDIAARVRPGPPTGTDHGSWTASLETSFRKIVDQRLSQLALNDRVPEQLRRANGRLKDTDAEIKRLKGELAAAKKAVAAANRPLSRKAAAKVLPAGTRRRRAIQKLRGR